MGVIAPVAILASASREVTARDMAVRLPCATFATSPSAVSALVSSYVREFAVIAIFAMAVLGEVLARLLVSIVLVRRLLRSIRLGCGDWERLWLRR
jgi:hypothetical protein